jgi:hypothetical protein
VGWKKLEPLWDAVIRARRATSMLPVLETILSEFGRRSPASQRERRTGEERLSHQRTGAEAPPQPGAALQTVHPLTVHLTSNG